MTFDKDKYWENRKAGKRGQGELPKAPAPKQSPTDTAERGFDNNGNMIVKNRAYRRRKIRLPGDNRFTQKTWTDDEGYGGISKKELKRKRKLGRH